jgi:hypothetical protein
LQDFDPDLKCFGPVPDVLHAYFGFFDLGTGTMGLSFGFLVVQMSEIWICFIYIYINDDSAEVIAIFWLHISKSYDNW